MRVATTERFTRWISGTGLVALAGFGWAVFVPPGPFWSAVIACGLLGSAAATALVLRSRAIPTLAQVVAIAETESVTLPVQHKAMGGAALRPEGEES